MRYFLFILMLVHGLIHLLGFVKSFNLAEVSQLTQNISKPFGIVWLITAILFVVSSIIFIFNNEYWWIPGIAAVILSQILIIMFWSDAKYGTIANIIILIPLIIAFMNSQPSSFKNIYKNEVQKALTRYKEMPILTESDIEYLPPPIRKYIHYTGVVGKPQIQNFRIVFRGNFRQKPDAAWLDIHSQQYNFFDEPTRLFFIESKMFGIPFDGLHIYADTSAIMQIKVASLLKVADAKGPLMTKGETVTLLNDMCLMAPASLIDKNIKWELIDSLTVKAIFTNKANTVSAMLNFNEKGELINFISNDRYQSADGKEYKNFPWSTPVKNYRQINGRKIAANAETIWHTPEGEFVYGKFDLVDVEYNCKEYK